MTAKTVVTIDSAQDEPSLLPREKIVRLQVRNDCGVSMLSLVCSQEMAYQLATGDRRKLVLTLELV